MHKAWVEFSMMCTNTTLNCFNEALEQADTEFIIQLCVYVLFEGLVMSQTYSVFAFPQSFSFLLFLLLTSCFFTLPIKQVVSNIFIKNTI